uniref:Histone H2A n=1 Tax=Solanum lycopersicum TaxID=4081 RepID=A0A3Q7GI79_SOLLC
MVDKGKNLGSNAKRRSRSSKAGLKFPVAIGKYAKRVSAGALVFLATVLEYLAVEVLELAGIAVRNDKRTHITPRHIQLATRFHKELYQFLRDLTIPNGGFIPKITNFCCLTTRVTLQRMSFLLLRRRRIRLIIPSLASQ